MTSAPILAAIDFSKASEIILRKAFQLAKKLDKALVILHVIEPRFLVKNLPKRSKIEQELQKRIEPFFAQFPDVRATFLCKKGKIERKILKLVDEVDASLVVIGTSGEDNFLREIFYVAIVGGLSTLAPCLCL